MHVWLGIDDASEPVKDERLVVDDEHTEIPLIVHRAVTVVPAAANGHIATRVKESCTS